jgi:hypothetical protein
MNHSNQRVLSQCKNRWLLLPACLALLIPATATRAAHLDEALLRAAPDILAQLRKHECKNVGVLPFQVKKGTRQASYTAAPLATSLPGRLENALIMRQEDYREPIGVIRDAAGTANRAKVGSYLRDPSAFNKLFKTSYDLAWGNKKVMSNAFLTGIVTNSGDHSKTTIQLQLLTPDSRQSGSLKLIRVGKPIVVMTDRSLLRDLGYTYVLSRSVAKRGVDEEQRDQQAVQQIRRQEQNLNQPSEGENVDPATLEIAGFAFELRYDGVRQQFRPMAQSQQGAKALQYQADPPKAGAKMALMLKRLAVGDQTLGVVLKVNGRSTWEEEDDEPIRCSKWIYYPKRKGVEDEYEGIQMDVEGKNVRPFEVLPAAESAKRASELGERAGWIDIDVFASGEDDSGDLQELKISARGMARSSKKYVTLKDLQAALRKANNVGAITPRGLVEPAREPTKEAKVLQGNFPNPVHLGGISIKYYDRSAKKDE